MLTINTVVEALDIDGFDMEVQWGFYMTCGDFNQDLEGFTQWDFMGMLHVWNIDLHLADFWKQMQENVGKYSSTMEHLGMRFNGIEGGLYMGFLWIYTMICCIGFHGDFVFFGNQSSDHGGC